jgi:hypothetical protein
MSRRTSGKNHLFYEKSASGYAEVDKPKIVP